MKVLTAILPRISKGARLIQTFLIDSCVYSNQSGNDGMACASSEMNSSTFMIPDILYRYSDAKRPGFKGRANEVWPIFTRAFPLTSLSLLRRNLGGPPRAEVDTPNSWERGSYAYSRRQEQQSESKSSRFMAPSASEPGGIQLYSRKYFLTCAMGGLLCCGLTHSAVTPVDVIKCNMQVDPVKYKSITGGFLTVFAEQGVPGLLRGLVPTLFGYSIQGAGKYGFYEYFKHYYTEKVGPEAAIKHKTLLYLAASASAEFLADIGLSPFEAVKVRIQTQPGFAKGISDGLPKLLASDGYLGFYKGIVPLWGRQIPYTMMKFATFENCVEAVYKHLVPVPKQDVSAAGQLGVSFVAGYIAGIACAIISHPADNLVSYLNSRRGATVPQAIKEMGTVALLTRGLPIRIFMIGTLTAAQWGIYDSFKVYVGLPTTGGSAVHEKDDAPNHT